MRRSWWLWCLVWSVLWTLSVSARAEELYVCVRPPDVPEGVGRWAYGPHGQTVLKSAEEFRKQSKGLTVYVLDPAAPPASVELLPARHRDLRCPGAKPSPPKPPPTASSAQAGAPSPAGNGESGKGTGEKKEKTVTDKLLSELTYGAAIASGQLNENDKRPDGKKYGVIGGNNPGGPNNPVAQASANLIVIVASVLTMEGFEKILTDALEKKARLIFTEKTFGKGAMDLILQSKRAKFFADALARSGAIGPYSVMSRFTAKLGGRWQAHHILEKSMMKEFTLGNPDLAPSVILTEIEHKAITKILAKETADAKTVQKLWKGYQKAYADKPHWLKAIEPFFKKGK